MRPFKSFLVASALLSVGAAHALTINATFDSSITSNANAAELEAGINNAIAEFQSSISDNTTVNITFKADESISLGQSNTSYYQVNYNSFIDALRASASGSATDATVLSHYPSSSTDPVIGGNNVLVTSALARRLGLVSSSINDSTISIKTSLCDLNRANGISAGTYDYQAVLMHEMDEVLGTSSALSGPNGTAAPTTIHAIDIFRYGTGAGTHSFSTIAGTRAFLSIDGVTHLVEYEQSGNGDYGDYITSATHRVQDAFGTTGVQLDLSNVELTSLDAVGWTVVPEPSTYGLMGAGAFAMMAFMRRHRRSRK